jgi:hypothetical protein
LRWSIRDYLQGLAFARRARLSSPVGIVLAMCGFARQFRTNVLRRQPWFKRIIRSLLTEPTSS